jgi:type I restriction-modification system DNA methylase subunit
MSLTASIKSIRDIMRKDVGVDGDAQRISQLVWLLFLKIFDAQEEELECTRDDYRSPLPQKLRWRNWANHHKIIDYGDTEILHNTASAITLNVNGEVVTIKR